MSLQVAPQNRPIGVFDSGHGGLTVLTGLRKKMPAHDFIYLGDHARAPIGDRSHAEIVTITRDACQTLFDQGCPLVILACNTATAIAGRTLQQGWLKDRHPHRRVLGIIAPTVEAVTQTPWHVATPVFPQRYNTDTVALFATSATVQSGVYAEEIAKRCPHVRLASQACPGLVPLIECGDPKGELPALVTEYVQLMLARLERAPEWAILGCTHYPLVEEMFRTALPAQTRLLGQPTIVAHALEDYLDRHPELGVGASHGQVRYLTTGDAAQVRAVAGAMLGFEVPFVGI